MSISVTILISFGLDNSEHSCYNGKITTKSFAGEKMILNKLGLHLNNWTGPSINTIRQQTNGALLKVLDINQNEIAGWRSRNPDGQVVYRPYFGDNNLDAWQQRCDAVIKLIQSNPGLVDIVDSVYNECYQTRSDGLERYAQVTIQCANYLRQNLPGIKYAAFAFSEANPPQLFDDWALVVPALEHIDYLSMHEYSWPHIHSEPGDPEGKNRETRNGQICGWQTFRYRFIYDWLRRSKYPMPGLILSEFGRDKGVTGQGLGGWRLAGDGIDQYVNELRWAAQQMAEDDYLLGCTIYCCGVNDSAWHSFDVAGERAIENLLQEHIVSASHTNWKPHPVEHPNNLYWEWRLTKGNNWPYGTNMELKAFEEHADMVTGYSAVTPEIARQLGYPI